MEKFIIEGGISLKGEMTPAGNKNAALPILAATLLTGEPVILHNLPDIRDVRDMRQLVASLGVKIEDLGNNSLRITATTSVLQTSTRIYVPESAHPSCWLVRY